MRKGQTRQPGPAVPPLAGKGVVGACLLAFLTGCEGLQERRGIGDVMAGASTRPVGRLAQADPAAAEPPRLDEDSSLPDYLAYAALHNPGLEAAFNRWKASLERVPQVRALPDPKFNYAYFIREVETRVGPQKQRFGLSQTFPWFGKLELRGDVAAQAAQAAHQRYEAAKLKLFHQVKTAYYEYYYLARAVDVMEAARDLVTYLERVARTKYKVGEAQHADVIRAQVELGKLEDRLRSLRGLRAPIVARLNAAMNRPADAEVPWPKSLPEERIALGDAELLSWLREANPELKALEFEILKQRRAIDLAKKDYFPDITVGVDFTDVGDAVEPNPQGLKAPFARRSAARILQGQGDFVDATNMLQSALPGEGPGDSGQDAWMLWMSLNIPIWYEKYSAGEREARARYHAALQSKTDRENTLVSQVKMALYYYRDAERKTGLYRDTLIPKADESLKATETAFRADRATFLDLIDAERVLLEFQLSYERARADRAQRLAELEMLVGKVIPATAATTQSAGLAPMGPPVPSRPEM